MMLVINAVYECLLSCFGVKFWYDGHSKNKTNISDQAFWIFACRSVSELNSGMISTQKNTFFRNQCFSEKIKSWQPSYDDPS